MPRKITHIVIHCSASNRSTTTVLDIERWHRERGWSGIGYHKVIDISGAVHQGRPDDVAGAHAEGFNSRSLGICLIGDFDKDKLLEADPQFRALVQVVATLCKRHGIPVANVIGHRDVYPILGKPVAKSCPGASAHALLPRLRELARRYL